MKDHLAASQSRSSLGRASRSAVGRVTGSLSRLFGGSATLQATGRFLRRQLWAWPVIAAILFGGTGWWVHRSVENAMREQRAADLNAIVDASVSAVRVWMAEQGNTVAVFDYGRTPEGIFYYAMEYLEGFNLDTFVAQHGPMPEARLVHLLRQVCGSLAEAHAAGLVHRDVKPANIFLTCRGGLNDFVKVLDFGLVKALEGAEQAHLTNPNAVTGTPLYLAPEAANRPDQMDARADVYAIGAVGDFLLTGSPVFTGTSVMEICMLYVKAAPQPPSARLGRPVSGDLETLLLRCLAKDPSERPADAAELLRELEACAVAGQWTAAEAAAWWAARDQGGSPSPATPPPPPPDATVAYEGAVVNRSGPSE
jgi:serine/threonine protein kinase